MESKHIFLATTIFAVTLLPGCNSQRPRVAWWKPTNMWGSKETAETSALARSAPELPSSKFEPMEPSSTAVASNTKSTTPAESRDTIASAPAAKYPSLSTTDYVSPASKVTDAATTASATPSASPAAGTMAPQTSPYSNDNSVSPSTDASSLANSTPSAPASDRYPPVDRYQTPPVASTLPSSSAPPFSPLDSNPAPNSSTEGAIAGSSPISEINPLQPANGPNRYDRYDTPAVASTPSPTVPIPSAVPSPSPTTLPPIGASSQPAANVAQVTLPSTPGGYRPGGTSTYNAASTANIATRPANPESATRYPAPRYEEPATPAAPSSYGTPDRYR